MTTADRIKFAREKIGMSQEELAKRLGLKSRSSIARIEKSGDDVTLKDVERLSDILGCSIPYLMGWENEITYKINSGEPAHLEEHPAPYGSNKKNALTDKEKHFIDLYQQLNPEERNLIDGMLTTLASKK